jgi:hypothetical protein
LFRHGNVVTQHAAPCDDALMLRWLGIGLVVVVGGLAVGMLTDEDDAASSYGGDSYRAVALARDALLTSDDLQPSFRREVSTGAPNLPCGTTNVHEVAAAQGFEGFATTLFQRRKENVFVSHMVIVFASAEEADRLLTAIDRAALSCDSYTYAEEGETAQIRVRQRRTIAPDTGGFPAVGVESGEGTEPTVWTRTTVYIRRASSVSILTAGSYYRNEARAIVERLAPSVARGMPGEREMAALQAAPPGQ